MATSSASPFSCTRAASFSSSCPLPVEEALKQMEQPPLSEEEGKQMFKNIAKKLQISEEELQSYFDKGYDGHKYRTSNWAYKIGIKIYQALGLDHRIRK